MTNMLKYIILLFVFLAMPRGNAAHAQTTYRLDQAPRYSETTGYGYDLTASPGKTDGSPFFFSVNVPDGNYKVTVRLGHAKR